MKNQATYKNLEEGRFAIYKNICCESVAAGNGRKRYVISGS